MWALLPVLPALWLGIGAALCLACVVTSRLFQPRLSSSRPIPMYSLEFAQWWLVSAHLEDQRACMEQAREYAYTAGTLELSVLFLPARLITCSQTAELATQSCRGHVTTQAFLMPQRAMAEMVALIAGQPHGERHHVYVC